jgi:hypothetical protein
MSEATYRDVPSTSFHTVEADGVRVFYRAAGNTLRPSFSSCMASRPPRSCFASSFPVSRTITA